MRVVQRITAIVFVAALIFGVYLESGPVTAFAVFMVWMGLGRVWSKVDLCGICQAARSAQTRNERPADSGENEPSDQRRQTPPDQTRFEP